MKKAYKGIITLIVFIVLNAFIFLAAKHRQGAFWISYLFLLLAFLLFAFVYAFLSDKTDKKLLGYPLNLLAGGYLLLESLIACIFMLVAYRFKTAAFLVQLILFAAFIIVLLSEQLVNSQIHQNEQLRGTELMNFRYTLEKMKLVQQKAEYSAPYRKAIDQTYDSLAGGQVSSTPEVKEIEKTILDKVDQLSQLVDKRDAASIDTVCREIIYLSQEREMRLKIKKPF